MDKNTIWGMLLMGAVILGFMYMNQPSAEERERQARELAEQQARADQLSDNGDILTLDSVSSQERATVVNTVKRFGTRDSVSGTYTLKAQGLDIKLNADGSFSGNVNAGGTEVPVTAILTADYGTIPQTTR